MKIQNNPTLLTNLIKLDEKDLILVEKIKSLSDENRKKIKRFVEIILNEDELQINRDFTAMIQSIVIPLKLLEREGSCASLIEAETLLYKLREFSSISFITCENMWINSKEGNNEYYTNNLLLVLDNPSILKKILSILDDSVPNILTVSKIPFLDKEKSTLVEKITVGSLIYDTDGGIYFKNKLIKMRPQIQNLCILFMKHHKELVDYSTIKDELIDAKKRSSTGFPTITKYVNELHKLLKNYFKKDVVFNQEKNAYIFDIGTNS